MKLLQGHSSSKIQNDVKVRQIKLNSLYIAYLLAWVKTLTGPALLLGFEYESAAATNTEPILGEIEIKNHYIYIPLFSKTWNSFYPKCPNKRGKVDFLLNWDLGTLYKSLGELVYPQVFKQLPADEEKAKVFAAKLQFLNDHLLKQGEWLTGDTPTIADISIGCFLTMSGL